MEIVELQKDQISEINFSPTVAIWNLTEVPIESVDNDLSNDMLGLIIVAWLVEKLRLLI